MKTHRKILALFILLGYLPASVATGHPLLQALSPRLSLTKNELIDNSWMRLILARDEGSERLQKQYESLVSFLKTEHSMQEIADLREVAHLKQEIFSKIDQLSDDEIIAEANKSLATSKMFQHLTFDHSLGRHLTLAELFLFPTVGGVDIHQTLFRNLHFVIDVMDSEYRKGVVSGERYDFFKMAVENYYLIIKAIEGLSKDENLVLIRTEILDTLADYLIKEPFDDYLVENLLALSVLFIPADTPQKRESLQNFVILIERLKQGSKEWRTALEKEENVERLGQVEREADQKKVEMAI